MFCLFLSVFIIQTMILITYIKIILIQIINIYTLDYSFTHKHIHVLQCRSYVRIMSLERVEGPICVVEWRAYILDFQSKDSATKSTREPSYMGFLCHLKSTSESFALHYMPKPQTCLYTFPSIIITNIRIALNKKT